jgi:hypothetical protein
MKLCLQFTLYVKINFYLLLLLIEWTNWNSNEVNWNLLGNWSNWHNHISYIEIPKSNIFWHSTYIAFVCHTWVKRIQIFSTYSLLVKFKDVTKKRLLILHFEQKIQKIGFFDLLRKIMIFSNHDLNSMKISTCRR